MCHFKMGHFVFNQKKEYKGNSTDYNKAYLMCSSPYASRVTKQTLFKEVIVGWLKYQITGDAVDMKRPSQ